MKLNHLNLCVNDVSEAVEFFQSLFGFELSGQKGDAIAAMTDEGGFSLVLSKLRTDGGDADAVTYPKDFHVGFYVDTTEEVDRFYERLTAASIHVEHSPRKMRGGYTLYFTALDGILFEVTSYAAEK
jgi:catechol 2,3-dioxygenase-like lactoylglutathione lyase family enzyme